MRAGDRDDKMKWIETEKKRLEINCKQNDQSLSGCLSQSRNFDVCKRGEQTWCNGRGKSFRFTMNPKVVFYLPCQMKISFKFIHSNLMSFLVLIFSLSCVSNVETITLVGCLCASLVRNQKTFINCLTIYGVNMKLFFFIKLNFIKMIFCSFCVRFFTASSTIRTRFMRNQWYNGSAAKTLCFFFAKFRKLCFQQQLQQTR